MTWFPIRTCQASILKADAPRTWEKKAKPFCIGYGNEWNVQFALLKTWVTGRKMARPEQQEWTWKFNTWTLGTWTFPFSQITASIGEKQDPYRIIYSTCKLFFPLKHFFLKSNITLKQLWRCCTISVLNYCHCSWEEEKCRIWEKSPDPSPHDWWSPEAHVRKGVSPELQFTSCSWLGRHCAEHSTRECADRRKLMYLKKKKKIIRRKGNSAAFLTCLMCLRERKTDNLLWATFQLLQSGIRDGSGELLDSSCPSTTSGWEEGFSSSSEPSQPSDSSFRSRKKKKKKADWS